MNLLNCLDEVANEDDPVSSEMETDFSLSTDSHSPSELSPPSMTEESAELTDTSRKPRSKGAWNSMSVGRGSSPGKLSRYSSNSALRQRYSSIVGRGIAVLRYKFSLSIRLWIPSSASVSLRADRSGPSPALSLENSGPNRLQKARRSCFLLSHRECFQPPSAHDGLERRNARYQMRALARATFQSRPCWRSADLSDSHVV